MSGKGNYKIPFADNGDQLDYPTLRYSYDATTKVSTPIPPDFRENFEFEDTLVYESFGRGRSSINFTWRRKGTGTTVSFFVTDMSDVVKHATKGEITGTFTFVKRGQNYGCRLVKLA